MKNKYIEVLAVKKTRHQVRTQVGRIYRLVAWFFWRRIGNINARFLIAEAICFTKLRLTCGANPILIHSMGKVGSQTIYRSLKHYSIQDGIVRTHYLTQKNLERNLQFHKLVAKRYAGTEIERGLYPYYAWRGQYMANRLDRTRFRGQRPVKVITMVRDPVAKNVAAFFENLRLFFGYDYEKQIKLYGEKFVIEQLINMFFESYVCKSDIISTDTNPLSWFDEELRPVFNVDVYAESFPKSEGYKIYNSSCAEVLLVRIEDLDRCAAEAFGKFLGIKNFNIVNKNVASKKGYASTYKRFVENLLLPKMYLDEMYNSRMARHFYLDEELDAFRRRWEA